MIVRAIAFVVLAGGCSTSHSGGDTSVVGDSSTQDSAADAGVDARDDAQVVTHDPGDLYASMSCNPDGTAELFFSYHPEIPAMMCIPPSVTMGEVLNVLVTNWDGRGGRFRLGDMSTGGTARANLSTNPSELEGTFEIELDDAGVPANVEWRFGDGPLLTGRAELGHCGPMQLGPIMCN